MGKKRINTIGYTIAKLDRTFKPKQSFEQRVTTFMQSLDRLYRKANYICSQIVTKNPMVAEYQDNLKKEREELHIQHLTMASRRKRSKLIYSNWGHQSEPSTQQLINDLRFGKL